MTQPAPNTPENPRFNHTKLPGWTGLTDSQRHWAGLLARRLDDSGHIDGWQYGFCVPVHYTDEFWELAGPDKYRTWAWDSLFTALTIGDQRVALLALLQARDYITRLQGSGFADFDAFAVAQHRIEGWLPR